MRTTIIALVAGVLVAIIALPAGAVPPERDTEYYEWQDLYAQCDGFKVVTDTELTFDITTFFDKNGDWSRSDLNGKATGVVYRDDFTGPTLQEKNTFRNVYSPNNPDGYGVGLGFNLTVPGYGWVYKLSGVYTWDPITGIDYEATGLNVTSYDGSPEAEAALCEYFG